MKVSSRTIFILSFLFRIIFLTRVVAVVVVEVHIPVCVVVLRAMDRRTDQQQQGKRDREEGRDRCHRVGLFFFS